MISGRRSTRRENASRSLRQRRFSFTAILRQVGGSGNVSKNVHEKGLPHQIRGTVQEQYRMEIAIYSEPVLMRQSFHFVFGRLMMTWNPYSCTAGGM